MPKIAIIGGSRFETGKFLDGFDSVPVKTMYGNVLMLQKDKVFFLPRHGKNRNIPAHKVNHKANICALNLMGVEKIYAINFVSSLSEKLKPGSFLIPHDYVDFNHESFFEFELRSIIPELKLELRKELKNAAKKAKITTIDNAVYIETKGPRQETPAEIRVIKKWGDIVGWTMAREATLAQELGIPYAALCFVDKFAAGIAKPTSKTPAKNIEKVALAGNKKIELLLNELVKRSR